MFFLHPYPLKRLRRLKVKGVQAIVVCMFSLLFSLAILHVSAREAEAATYELTVNIKPNDASDAGANWEFRIIEPYRSEWDGPYNSGQKIEFSVYGNSDVRVQIRGTDISGWTTPDSNMNGLEPETT